MEKRPFQNIASNGYACFGLQSNYDSGHNSTKTNQAALPCMEKMAESNERNYENVPCGF